MQFVPLEQVIIANLDNRLYPGMDIVSAYPFRVTRNADIARNEEEAEDLFEMINDELRERRTAPIVRLEVDSSACQNRCWTVLQEEMGLEADRHLSYSWLFASQRSLPAGRSQFAAPEIRVVDADHADSFRTGFDSSSRHPADLFAPSARAS
jgi:polyphosphate kinase